MNSTLSVPCSSAPADVRLSVSSPEASHVQWHEDHEDTAATAAAPIASPDDATRVGLMTASSVDSADADDMIVCRVKKYEWSPPPGEEHHVYRPHQGEGSQYLRDVVLGVNDGCLSTFLVIVGLVAGGASVTTCLLSAISTAVAGAISMGLGEYVATKSQANVNKGEEQLEVGTTTTQETGRIERNHLHTAYSRFPLLCTIAFLFFPVFPRRSTFVIIATWSWSSCAASCLASV